MTPDDAPIPDPCARLVAAARRLADAATPAGAGGSTWRFGPPPDVVLDLFDDLAGALAACAARPREALPGAGGRPIMIPLGATVLIDPAELVRVGRTDDGRGVNYQLKGSDAVHYAPADDAEWEEFRGETLAWAARTYRQSRRAGLPSQAVPDRTSAGGSWRDRPPLF